MEAKCKQCVTMAFYTKMLNEATRDIVNERKSGTAKSKNGAFLSRHPAPMQRDIIIVCGMYCGWTNTRIANIAATSPNKVRLIRRKFERAPGLLFNLPILEPLTTLDKNKKGNRRPVLFYQCGFCGLIFKGPNNKPGRRHVATHVLSEQIVRVRGID